MARAPKPVSTGDSIAQTTAEIAGLIFFLVMLGELAWSKEHKNKIIKFYGLSE